MKTYCFKLYQSERNLKLQEQIKAAGRIYNHWVGTYPIISAPAFYLYYITN